MNREQRRKVKKRAEEIWKLETLATLAKDKEVKAQVEKDIQRIASKCSLEELYLIDEYITEKYVSST